MGFIKSDLANFLLFPLLLPTNLLLLRLVASKMQAILELVLNNKVSRAAILLKSERKC